MKLWIDFLTPKQLLFFKPVWDEAERRGWRVLLTTRRYREIDYLTERLGVKAYVVGRHGGGDLYSKLKCGVNRMRRLLELVNSFKPDVALSTSPEAARVAFGLGVPHVAANDSPHSRAVAKLVVPLSVKLLTPWVIPKESWTHYGIGRDDVVWYKAIDPVMWLKHLNLNYIDEKLRNEISERKHTVTIRVEEVQASYIMSDKPTVLEEAIAKLSQRLKDSLIVVLPRYGWQMRYLKRRFKGLRNVYVVAKPIDGPALMKLSTIFVGSGGTMTWEAALLGVPSISCYPKELMDVERFLIDFGLVIRARSEELVDLVESLMSRIDEVKARQVELSAKLWGVMEDPLEVFMSVLEGFHSKT